MRSGSSWTEQMEQATVTIVTVVLERPLDGLIQLGDQEVFIDASEL